MNLKTVIFIENNQIIFYDYFLENFEYYNIEIILYMKKKKKEKLI